VEMLSVNGQNRFFFFHVVFCRDAKNCTRDGATSHNEKEAHPPLLNEKHFVPSVVRQITEQRIFSLKIEKDKIVMPWFFLRRVLVKRSFSSHFAIPLRECKEQ